jgi:hypothetical protein
MAELKTKVNDKSVTEFIDAVDSEAKREDAYTLLKTFERITGEKPKMWGSSMIGFGQYHYKSERSSQEGDWLLTGFSPRKANLTLYLHAGIDAFPDLLKKLGKHKLGKGCLYINKLADVDQTVLEDLIEKSFTETKKINNVK